MSWLLHLQVPDESFAILLEYLEPMKGKARETTVEKAELVMKEEESTEDEGEVSTVFKIFWISPDFSIAGTLGVCWPFCLSISTIPLFRYIFVEHACDEQEIVVTICNLVECLCVRMCVRPCPDHNFTSN